MDRDPFSMQDKMAVVTGAARGLGRAAVVGLAAAGAGVALIALEAARCDETAREITALGRRGAAYAATKGARAALIRDLACEWGQHGIRVNAAAPCRFHTDMNATSIFAYRRFLEQVVTKLPMRRIGQSHQRGGPIMCLASEASSMITGLVLPVDGGAAATCPIDWKPDGEANLPMSNKSLQDLIARHEAFLECRPVERPLVGHWIGGYYPAEQFPRGTAQWRLEQRLDPQDVRFSPFADDYESLYQAHRAADDDFFYVGSSYWGIPWLEAILGCPVSVAAANCRTETFLNDPQDFTGTDPDLNANPWLDALLRFTEELLRFADGRFPVCPPLLRGPGDVACAMLSGMDFVTGLIDHPEAAKRLLDHIARTRLAVLRRLQAVLPAWHETRAAGGYPSRVWCRRTVAYYQEDSAALLNPRLFREFLLPLARAACAAAEVNFIHLHSACLYPLEMLLEDNSFDAIQINIDHAGVAPPLAALLPALQRVQAAGRPLLVWGEFTPDDWQLIRRELSPVGLSLQPIVRDCLKPGRWQ